VSPISSTERNSVSARTEKRNCPAPDRSAGPVRVRRLHRGRDVVRREAERAHLVRVDLDANLILRRADHRDARDARQLFQPARVHVLRGAGERPQVALDR
jgi:hypothetical protein